MVIVSVHLMNFSVHKIKEMIIRLACTSHVPQFTISGYHELSSHELSIDLCLAYRSRLTKVVNLSPLITDALIGRPWPNTNGREEVAVTLNVHVVCCIPLVELMMQCLSDDGENKLSVFLILDKWICLSGFFPHLPRNIA